MLRFEDDVVGWAEEQAGLLRAGRLAELDLLQLADEIEDVGKSEQRELTSRMAVLIGHLLKWHYQPARRGAGWQQTIRAQRKDIEYALLESPSLRTRLTDPRWIDLVWAKGVALAATDTGLDGLPDEPIWSLTDAVLKPGWLPD